MKTRIASLSLVAVLAASTAYAGSMEEPMMEEEVMAPVVVEEKSQADSYVVPLMLLAFVAAVLAN